MKLYNITKELEIPHSEHENLYRYHYYGTRVQFVQNTINGHISSVNIIPSHELREFQFYAEDNDIQNFSYPKRVYVRTAKNLFVEDFDNYIKVLNHAKRTAEAIESIFERDLHLSKYKEETKNG